jgi:hypothetical protein
MNSSCMKNTWRVDRGMAGSGKEKQIFYIGNSLVPVGKLISPGWYYQPKQKGGYLVPVGNTNRD